jgi:hypothetical protein
MVQPHGTVPSKKQGLLGKTGISGLGGKLPLQRPPLAPGTYSLFAALGHILPMKVADAVFQLL